MNDQGASLRMSNEINGLWVPLGRLPPGAGDADPGSREFSKRTYALRGLSWSIGRKTAVNLPVPDLCQPVPVQKFNTINDITRVEQVEQVEQVDRDLS